MPAKGSMSSAGEMPWTSLCAGANCLSPTIRCLPHHVGTNQHTSRAVTIDPSAIPVPAYVNIHKSHASGCLCQPPYQGLPIRTAIHTTAQAHSHAYDWPLALPVICMAVRIGSWGLVYAVACMAFMAVGIGMHWYGCMAVA